MTEYEEIVMSASDEDCYVSSKSAVPDERDTNFNGVELLVGKPGSFVWRFALAVSIASRYPTGTLFNNVDLRLTPFETVGLAKSLVVETIPAPIINDTQVTYNRRSSIVPWVTPGIDVQSPPTPVAAALFEGGPYQVVSGLQEHWQYALDEAAGNVNIRGAMTPETGLARYVKFRSSTFVTASARPTWLVTFTVPIYVGYKVYLKAGTMPNPATDTPIATVDSAVLSAALDIGALGLTANTDYYGLIVAFNTVGDAVTGAPFGFRTDGAGLPLIIPTPVTNVKAMPLAGGNVRVSWGYNEANPLAVADTFEIEVAGAPGTFPFSVPHVAPKRDYTRDLTIGEDGLFQLRVRSAKGGLYQANVSPIPVVLDATPPAVVPVTLEAVE